MSEAAAPYPTYPELVARRREARRARLLAAARAVEEVARAHGLGVLVFGSLATGDVHEGSDLDVALMGDRQTAYAIHGEAFFAACLHGVEADVVAFDAASPSLRARILADGVAPDALA